MFRENWFEKKPVGLPSTIHLGIGPRGRGTSTRRSCCPCRRIPPWQNPSPWDIATTQWRRFVKDAAVVRKQLPWAKGWLVSSLSGHWWRPRRRRKRGRGRGNLDPFNQPGEINLAFNFRLYYCPRPSPSNLQRVALWPSRLFLPSSIIEGPRIEPLLILVPMEATTPRIPVKGLPNVGSFTPVRPCCADGSPLRPLWQMDHHPPLPSRLPRPPVQQSDAGAHTHGALFPKVCPGGRGANPANNSTLASRGSTSETRRAKRKVYHTGVQPSDDVACALCLITTASFAAWPLTPLGPKACLDILPSYATGCYSAGAVLVLVITFDVELFGTPLLLWEACYNKMLSY